MSRTRAVAIVGANKEGLALLPLFDRDPGISVRLVADPNPDAPLFRLDPHGSRLASKYRVRVARNLDALEEEGVDLVVDASHDPETAQAIRAKKPAHATVMSALSASLLWGTKDPGAGRSPDRQSALLTGLGEMIGAVDLAANEEDLLALVLSIAIESTGADCGSLLLVEPSGQALRIRVAEGVPHEVVAGLRIPIGEGISGMVAKEGRPLRISGPADPALTGASHVRDDVAAAMSVPMRAAAQRGDGAVIGVLNVSHRTDPDAFSDADLDFLVRLAAVEGEIITRSQEYARLKAVAARFDFYRDVRERLDEEAPLAARLDAVCRSVAASLPGGTCTVYRYEAEAERLVVAATSREDADAPRARGTPVSLDEGLEGAVARDGRGRRIVDPIGGGIVVAFPLVAGGTVEGVLVLATSGQDDAPLVERSREAAPLLAEAIRRDREQAASAGRATRLAAITEAGVSIVAATTTEGLAQVVAASAAKALEAEIVLVRLRDEAGRFPVRSALGLPDASADRRARLEGEGRLSARVTRERRPGRDGSWLACPILVGDDVVGTVAVGGKVAGDQDLLVRLVAYVEQTLEERASRAGEPSDGASGSAYLFRRLADEIARSRRNGRHVGLVVARVEPEETLAAAPGLERILAALDDVFRTKLRSYDEVVRVAPTRIAVLLPDTMDGARTVCERLVRAAQEGGVAALAKAAGGTLAVGAAQAPNDLPPGHVEDSQGARVLLERASRGASSAPS